MNPSEIHIRGSYTWVDPEGGGGHGVRTPPPPDKKLEDLKVLKRSPDLLNNVKIGQGQLCLII